MAGPYWKSNSLPDFTVEHTTPDICAVCGEPSVGLFTVVEGKKPSDALVYGAKEGRVTAKLCAKHAQQRTEKPKKPGKPADDSDQLSLF